MVQVAHKRPLNTLGKMSKRDQAISISIRVVPLVSIHHALLLYRFDSVKRVTNCAKQKECGESIGNK